MDIKDMVVAGAVVDAEVLKTAWDRAIASGRIGDLESYIPDGLVVVNRRLLPSNHLLRSDYWVAQEIANRLRQKARKLGIIKMEGKPRKWVIKDQ